MAQQVKNYIRFYGLTNVDSIKISTITSNTLEQARQENNVLDSDLVIQTDFQGSATVDASYFSPSGAEGGLGLAIYRKTPSQKFYEFVCQLGTYYVTDYNVANDEYYHYLIAAQMSSGNRPVYNIYQNRNAEGGLDYIKAHWDSWSIYNIEELADNDEDNEKPIYKKTGNVWVLRFNINEESLNQNLSITTWDTLSKYPKISIGQKNYESSQFTGLLGSIKEYRDFDNNGIILNDNYKQNYGYTEKEDVDNPYGREVEKLHRWQEFCADGKLKLLKDPKGNKWVIQIIGVPNNNIDIKSNIQETTISFEWQEVLDINEISIIGDDAFRKVVKDYNVEVIN